MRRMFSEKQIKEMISAGAQSEIAEALEGDISIGGDLSVAGDSSVGGDLSVTGDIAGAEITGDSIIENMSGYSMTQKTMTNFEVEPVYGGMVKNGNKLTMVYFAQITKKASDNNYNDIVWVYVPDDVFAKIYPFTIGAFEDIIASVRTTGLPSSSLGSFITVDALIRKASNRFNVSVRATDANLAVDASCLVRLEFTFLLSDNLIPSGE